MQHSGHGTAQSAGDGCDACTQCHCRSPSNVQQHVVSTGTVVVVVVGATVLAVVLVVVVVVVVVVAALRHAHVPLLLYPPSA